MGKRGLAGVTPGKPPTRPPTRRERGAAMGQGRRKGGNQETGGKVRPAKPWECGETTGPRGLRSGPQVPWNGGRGEGQ